MARRDSYHTRPVGEAVATSLPSRLDADDAVRWRESLRQHLAEGRTLHVIDVDAVDLLSATTLGFLISILQMVRDCGGAVSLVATRERSLRTLRVTGLDRVFPVGRTVREATAMITGFAGEFIKDGMVKRGAR